MNWASDSSNSPMEQKCFGKGRGHQSLISEPALPGEGVLSDLFLQSSLSFAEPQFGVGLVSAESILHAGLTVFCRVHFCGGGARHPDQATTGAVPPKADERVLTPHRSACVKTTFLPFLHPFSFSLFGILPAHPHSRFLDV